MIEKFTKLFDTLKAALANTNKDLASALHALPSPEKLPSPDTVWLFLVLVRCLITESRSQYSLVYTFSFPLHLSGREAGAAIQAAPAGLLCVPAASVDGRVPPPGLQPTAEPD